jgi:hypothetical protein
VAIAAETAGGVDSLRDLEGVASVGIKTKGGRYPGAGALIRATKKFLHHSHSLERTMGRAGHAVDSMHALLHDSRIQDAVNRRAEFMGGEERGKREAAQRLYGRRQDNKYIMPTNVALASFYTQHGRFSDAEAALSNAIDMQRSDIGPLQTSVLDNLKRQADVFKVITIF